MHSLCEVAEKVQVFFGLYDFLVSSFLTSYYLSILSLSHYGYDDVELDCSYQSFFSSVYHMTSNHHSSTHFLLLKIYVSSVALVCETIQNQIRGS